MFSSKTSNDKIEKLHKRALQIIESDFTAMYENLIAIDESITIHKRNLQFLMTEIFKTLHKLNFPSMKKKIVRLDSPYILKSKQRLKVDRVKTSGYRFETAFLWEEKSGILWGIVLYNYQVATHLSKRSRDGMVQTAPAKSSHDP